MRQESSQSDQIHEAVGVFHSLENLDAAVAELEVTAFSRQDISVLDRISLGKPAPRQSIEAMEDDPATPRGISIRPEEKAIGAAVLVGGCAYFGGCMAAISMREASPDLVVFAITCGSLLFGCAGLLMLKVIGTWFRKSVERQLAAGGLLLWVRATGPDREKLAQDIMRKHGAHHVHIHDVTQ